MRQIVGYDVFFSTIVLQHNPPPLIAYILRQVLTQLNAGGVAFFKVQTYGLGYSLLVFAYDKRDDEARRTGRMDIQHTIFVEKHRTGDFQTTSGLRRLLENSANREDILAFFQERMLPVDEIEANALADEVMKHPPELGYLTVSNALQWRLQYSRVIEQAGAVGGILRLA